MLEYIIERTDGDWFDLHVDRYPEVLRPRSVPSRPIPGWGDHRISVAGVEVSFSYESPGIQITVDGEIDEALADRIVAEICENLVRETGQQGRVIPI